MFFLSSVLGYRIWNYRTNISILSLLGWPRFLPPELRDDDIDTFKQITNDKALFGTNVGNNMIIDLDMTWMTSVTEFKVTITGQTEMLCSGEEGIVVRNCECLCHAILFMIH